MLKLNNFCVGTRLKSFLDTKGTFYMLSAVSNRFSYIRFVSKSCPGGQKSEVSACPAQAVPASKAQDIDPDCHVDRDTWEKARPFKDLPGPNALPILGNTWRFIPKIGEYGKRDVNDLCKIWRKQYGDVVRIEKVAGIQDSVFLLSPEYIETIYKQESMNPQRDILKSMTYFRNNMRQDIFEDAKGLLTTNGPDWHTFRNKVNAIMMQPKIVRHYIKPVDAISMDFIEKIKRLRNSKNEIGDQIMNETNKWSLETIAYLALDARLGCLADNLPEDSSPQKMVTNAREIFQIGEKLDFTPSIWKHVSTPAYRKGMKLYHEQIKLAEAHIKTAMEKITEKRTSGNAGNSDKEASVLEKLLDIDPKVAVVMVSDMLLAGIDTTATSFVNILYHISTNALKQEKLREEILTLLPNKNSELKEEHLNQLPYMRACIKESARLYPVTPGTMRDLTKNTVLAGYQIPKGMRMVFVHMFTSITEEQYARPNEFIPERWLRDNVDSELHYKKAHPFSTMHFGFGPRSCIGRRFAELEMEVALINFIRNFQMSWEGEPPKKTTTSINHLTGPFGFIFKDLN